MRLIDVPPKQEARWGEGGLCLPGESLLTLFIKSRRRRRRGEQSAIQGEFSLMKL